MYLCKFDGENPIGSEDTAQKRLILQFFKNVMMTLKMGWTWKLGQGHQNHINSSVCNNDPICKFGQNLVFKVLVWPWK